MPLNNKTKPSKGKAAIKASGRNLNGTPVSKNVIGAGKKAKASLKKDAVKKLVRAKADEQLGISRGLGPDEGYGYKKALSASNRAGKAGLPMNGPVVALGSGARKTASKRIRQSVNARKK
jgi:hypothetical protein